MKIRNNTSQTIFLTKGFFPSFEQVLPTHGLSWGWRKGVVVDFGTPESVAQLVEYLETYYRDFVLDGDQVIFHVT